MISIEIFLIFLYLYGLSFNAAAVFNLSAPLVVHEQDLRFNVTISLVEPSDGTSIPVEIIIMETKITAIPSSKYVQSIIETNSTIIPQLILKGKPRFHSYFREQYNQHAV